MNNTEREIRTIKEPRPGLCGPATIAMTLDYFGIPNSIEEIARDTKWGKDGTGIEEIRKYFEKFELVTEVSKDLTWEKLKHEREITKDPIWVHWWYDLPKSGKPEGHYCLVKSVGEKNIELHDSYTGKVISIKREKWMKLWRDTRNPSKDGSDRGWAMRVRIKEETPQSKTRLKP